MQADFWHRRWKNNQINFHQMEINSHLQDYWQAITSAPADSQIFVPLCGKSLDMLWLRAQGYQVLGVELSPIAVKDFFAENQLVPEITPLDDFEQWQFDNISLLAGDFFALTPAHIQQCRAIYDRASLIALPPDMRQRYAEHLCHIAPKQAQILLITAEYDQNTMQGPPFAVLEDEVHTLYSHQYQIERLHHENSLDVSDAFRQRGMQRMDEKVYLLTPR